jgi:hypothetical protein
MAYYVIKTKLSDYVLDAEGGGKEGHRVITFDRHGQDNQVWYDDPLTGTIRLKAGNLVLAIKNNELCVEKYKEGNPDQQWVRHDQYIRNRVDPNKVLDVYEGNKNKGAKIGAWSYHGNKNQSWEFIFVGGEAPVTGASQVGAGRQFYIVSEMNGKVLDISGGSTSEGAKVVMWDKHSPPAPNQLWYIDPSGYIRSSLNHMTFCSGKAGEDLRMQPASGDPRNQWTFHGVKLGSRAGECLDISGGGDSNGTSVCSFAYKDQKNQHWIAQYA